MLTDPWPVEVRSVEAGVVKDAWNKELTWDGERRRHRASSS
jgi:hypothetical protein